jgi:hypothetical protein
MEPMLAWTVGDQWIIAAAIKLTRQNKKSVERLINV